MFTFHPSGQSSIFPRPELRTFWKDSHTKPPFGVTSDEVVIIAQIHSLFIPNKLDLTKHGAPKKPVTSPVGRNKHLRFVTQKSQLADGKISEHQNHLGAPSFCWLPTGGVPTGNVGASL